MKQEIIDSALESFKQTTGIEATFNEQGPLSGVLKFDWSGSTHIFTVEIRQEIRNYQLSQIESHYQENEQYLIVVHRLFPKIKEELRQKGVSYLEANGNMHLKKQGLFLFVDTQKPLSSKQSKGNRAFTKTGLKVLFYLLQHKEAIHLPQRELASLTQVALGTIPQVLDGLKEAGYLLPLNRKTYVWENRKELLDRWVTEYATLLRPKLWKGRYALHENWEAIPLERSRTVWGGEPAADRLTHHLRPEKFLLYTKENRMDLIKNYKLMPDKNGEVYVLDMFWKHNEDTTIPPLLVYADLMLEGGKRNKETAEKIYHEYIEPNL